MINDLVGTNRRMCFWLYFIAQTATRTCDPLCKRSAAAAAAAANGHSSSRRPAVAHKYVGANRKEVSSPGATRYFASKELWIKSKPCCLHWLIIPQNVAALQNGRFERGVHRKVRYVLQAETRFLRSICLWRSSQYHTKWSSSSRRHYTQMKTLKFIYVLKGMIVQ